LKIVNYIKESFQEYEDHLSIVLFCYGCNMKCSYCYNYSYITDSANIIDESVETIIDSNITPITDGLVFLGGEPTIYGNSLLKVAKYVKETYNFDIKLFTNGTNPELVIKGVELGYFDLVSIDFKCYFPSSDILYSGKNWNKYLWGLETLFATFYAKGITDKLEIRMTVIPSIQQDVVIIKNLCYDKGIKFIQQTDFKQNYKNIGVLGE
jgi:pyruvate formate lyase activating enzyme